MLDFVCLAAVAVGEERKKRNDLQARAETEYPLLK